MDKISNLKKELNRLPRKDNPSKFFKTSKGDYSYGDIFLGISVPDQRRIAKKYTDLDLSSIEILIKSSIHEERSIALIILVNKFNNSNINTKESIYNFYLSYKNYVNNWDLVDMSAEYILGFWLYDKDRFVLDMLSLSNVLWDRRIAIVSTHYFIRRKEYKDTFRIAKILINDREDLIQKALGWMLREVGKYCSEDIETKFLEQYYKDMSRVSLRYAIERFPEKKRVQYLKGFI